MPGPEPTAAVLRAAVRGGIRPVFGPHVPHRIQRAYIDTLALSLPGVRVERSRERVGGVQVYASRPHAMSTGATVIYFHGGGYVTGSARAYGALASRLATAARAAVLAAEYRLAPEHPFPAAYDDGFAVYRALIEAGQDPARLAVAGDSAGGGLALATVLRARDEGLPVPGRLVMFSPWLDLRERALPRGEKETDPVLTRAGIDRWARAYCAGHEAGDPRISPGLAADLHGLPPTLIQYDSAELLAVDSTEFAARARAAGCRLTLQPFTGLWHVFELFTQLPQARVALRMAGEFIAADRLDKDNRG